jgi:hypothetical protein
LKGWLPVIHKLVRVFRTPHSERFLLQMAQGVDGAALDLHYLPDGNVTGTVFLFHDARISDEKVPELLKEIDEDLLPEVSVEHGNLNFTVIRGQVIGTFSAEATEDGGKV